MLINRIQELRARLSWHADNAGFTNNLTPTDGFKHSESLPQDYCEFVKLVGTGEIGSGTGPDAFLIHSVSTPEFYHSHEDWGIEFDGAGPFFDIDNKHLLDNILIIGHDVDREWIGYDIRSNGSEVIACLNNQADRKTGNFVSYIESVLAQYENYLEIDYPSSH